MHQMPGQSDNITVVKEERQGGKRNAAADRLKCIAILAVAFIHGSFLLPFSPINLDFSHTTIDLLSQGFRFCVPVFFFLWAYFQEKSILRKGGKNAYSCFYKLLIPFLCWSMVYLQPSVFITSIIILSSMQATTMSSPLKIRDSKIVRLIAGYTLGIFCLNPLVILTLAPAIRSTGFQPQFTGCSIVMAILSTLLITAICVLLIFLLKRIKLGFLVAN